MLKILPQLNKKAFSKFTINKLVFLLFLQYPKFLGYIGADQFRLAIEKRNKYTLLNNEEYANIAFVFGFHFKQTVAR